MSLETLVLLQQALPLPLEQESLPARLLLSLALELLESLPKMAPDIWALSSPKHEACGGSEAVRSSAPVLVLAPKPP